MFNVNQEESKEDETLFDTYEIDTQIFKSGEYVQKTSTKAEEVKNRFRFLQGITKEELKKKNPKSDDFLKYFAKITTKDFEYIGILSNQLKREKYGYSLMDNKDEFLGEYKNEIRDGFGIYKYHHDENEDSQEYYIGEYKNNSKTGLGLYLKIFKSIKDDSTGEKKLINFNCGIGTFQDDLFKNGKIFSVDYDNETLYKGKINEIGIPSDEEALIVQGDKIFSGKLKDGELVEGRNIIVDEKGDKKKAYYFSKSNNRDEPYNFDIYKNEEKDGATIQMNKKSSVKTYKAQIQNIFNDINDAMIKFANFDTAIKTDFEKDVKNKIKSNLERINKD